jgi:hypothetical protein
MLKQNCVQYVLFFHKPRSFRDREKWLLRCLEAITVVTLCYTFEHFISLYISDRTYFFLGGPSHGSGG